MRIVVGLRPLFPGKVGGQEIYVRELLREWAEWARDDEWIVLVNAETAPSFASPGPWMRFITVPEVHDLALWARTAESFGPALYFSPMLVIDPPSVGLPTVVNIPDLQHEFFPSYFDAATLAMRRVHFPLSARRAAAVLTHSGHARDTIIEKFKVPADKVHGVQLAAGDEFRAAPVVARVQAFREKYRLPENFGFFPAHFWPHKNHETLFKALSIIRKRHGEAPLIALSGFAAAQAGPVEAAIRQHGLQDCIRILGYLDRAEVPVAYQAAQFLVFPSKFEGFGIPVAEAMAAGCPVVCSDIPSLSEFTGDGAITCDPDDAEAFAAGMHQLMTDPAVRTRLRDRGRQRSAELTWKRSAKLSYAVLREVWERWHAQPRAAVVSVPWPPASGAESWELPPAEPASILQFTAHNESEADQTVSSRFAASGLDALLAPHGTGEEWFDLLRLKSADNIALTRLSVGPVLAPDLRAWLARHPRATPYEIVLRVATSGMTAIDDALPQQAEPATATHPALPAREGLRLSAKYFGEIDPGWLRAAGESTAGTLPFVGRWRPAQRRVGKLASAWHHLRLTGKLPPGLTRAVIAKLRPPSAAAPTADGWIGRRGEVILRPAADGNLRLRLELPPWPMRRPPELSIRLGRRTLYRGILRQPGIYAFCWGWPAGEESVRLRLASSAVCVPAEQGLGSDARELSVRILKD